MKYFDELSYEDMSAITKTSVGALKASCHHAVKKSRRLSYSIIKPKAQKAVLVTNEKTRRHIKE
ncbi:MAG: hypothetical protein U5K54_01175 [Cytophagales bacterium]|nr:hypothetical protein [Cytophagales bacterium]